MANRRRVHVAEHYELMALRIDEYSARVDAAINYEARDPERYRADAKVFEFHSSLDITATATWPEGRAGQVHYFSIHGGETTYAKFSLTLADCQTTDEDGCKKYRRLRGRDVPVYDAPKGIGLLNKRRGMVIWNAYVWVSPQTVHDMLALLPHVSPLYLSVHVRTIERTRWVAGLTLQTTDPADE